MFFAKNSLIRIKIKNKISFCYDYIRDKNFYRLWIIAVAFVLYTLSTSLQLVEPAKFSSPLDQLIPFFPSMIWAYLSFFVLWAIVLFVPPDEDFQKVTYTMLLMLGCGAILHWLYPICIDHPTVIGNTPAEYVIKVMYRMDTARGCFPSLHVAGSFLFASIWCYYAQEIWKCRLIWGWAITIIVSTVLCGQHYIIDLLGGLILGYFCFQYFKKKNEFQIN